MYDIAEKPVEATLAAPSRAPSTATQNDATQNDNVCVLPLRKRTSQSASLYTAFRSLPQLKKVS